MDMFGRSLWLVFALGGVLLAAPLLDRSAARSPRGEKPVWRSGLRLRWLDVFLRPVSRSVLGALAAAEIKLCLRERRLWWWVAALAAIGLQVFGNSEVLRIGILLGWLLPIDILARAALREKDQRTGAIVFAAAGIVPRLLLARFLVGCTVLLALIFPGLLRLLMIAPLGALAATVVTVSIVGWSLALGALFRNAWPFELLLVGSMYLGLQGLALFDLGAGAASTLAWHGAGLLLATLVLTWAWPRLART